MKIGPWSFVFAFAAISLSAGAAVRSVPSQYSTIADAITAADADDIIEVAAGTYTVSAAIAVNKAVTIRGVGIGQTVVSGNKAVQVFNVSAAATLENMTITGGKTTAGSSGCGVHMTAGTLRNCSVEDSAKDGWNGGGAAVWAVNAGTLVTDCVITKCNAWRDSIAANIGNGAVMQRTLIYDNKGAPGSIYSVQNVYVGAVVNVAKSGIVSNCTVAVNYCMNSHAVNLADKTSVFKDNIVYGNTGRVAPSASGWTIGGTLNGSTGNFTDNPDFVDPANGDFRLAPASAAMGKGSAPYDTSVPAVGAMTDTDKFFVGDAQTFTAAVWQVSGDFTWNFGDGTEPVVTAVPYATHTYANPGTYTLSVSAGGLTQTRTDYVRVYPRSLTISYSDYIEDALDNSIDGMTIYLRNGTYVKKSTADIIIEKGVTITSESGNKDDVILRFASGNATHARYALLSHPKARIQNLTISPNNSATPPTQQYFGALMFVNAGTISNCVMRNCTSTRWGNDGLIYLNGADAVVTHSVISNLNAHANGKGGAMHVVNGTVDNCLIVRNSSVGSSSNYGVITMDNGQLVNCTVSANSGVLRGGIYLTSNKAKVYNCIISDNTMSQSIDAANGVHCGQQAACYYNCFAPVSINSTCQSADVIGFKDMTHDDFTILPNSKAVGNGTTTGLTFPATDLAGNARLNDQGNVDIGCYALKIDGVMVSVSADKAAWFAPAEVTYTATVLGADPEELTYKWDVYGDGSVIATTHVPTLTYMYERFGFFQAKLTVTKSGTDYDALNSLEFSSNPKVLYVDAASENPTVPYATRATAAHTIADAIEVASPGATVSIKPDLYLVPATVSVTKDITLLGEGNDPSAVMIDGNGARRALYLNSPGAVISSLTLQRGYRGTDSGTDGIGQGVYIDTIGGTVTNCIIRNCSSSSWSQMASALATHAGAPALVTHCVISNNTSNSSVAQKYSDSVGGAIVSIGGGEMRNSLVIDNYYSKSATVGGDYGTVFVGGGSLVNCTIANNSGRTMSGVYCQAGGVTNCVIAENVVTGTAIDHGLVFGGTADRFSKCLAPEAITADCYVAPHPFASLATGDYRLAAGSPGIDNAEQFGWMTGATDLGGSARIIGNGPDIGCYEAPEASFAASFTADKESGFGPLSVTFTAVPVKDSGSGVECSWYIDGSDTPESESGLVFTHVFPYGKHQVRLVARDLGNNNVYEAPGYVEIYSAPSTMYVAPPDGVVTSDYPYATCNTAATNILDAIESALPGTEIVLLRGQHRKFKDSLIFIDKALDIRGETGHPEDVIFQRNRGQQIFALNHPQATIRDITLDGNRFLYAQNTAQLVEIDDQGGVVSNCVLRNAQYGLWGGKGSAVRTASAAALVSHVIISNCWNTSTGSGNEGGEAIYLNGGRLEDSLIIGNGLDPATNPEHQYGGAVYLESGTVINCTVISNRFPGCAGIYSIGGTVINTIVSGNASCWDTQLGQIKGTATYSHCLTSVGTEIENVIAVEPFADTFCDNPKRLWWPSRTSKAFDKGDKTVVTSTTDLGGRPRRLGRSVDIGAYEDGLIGTAIILR